MKYRKKPVVIEATQWFKNGDHPKDNSKELFSQEIGAFLSEGEIVRRYNHPGTDGYGVCIQCEHLMNSHGWIDTLEGGHIVCPKDYIITGIQSEMYPCKPDIFKATYEAVEKDSQGCTP